MVPESIPNNNAPKLACGQIIFSSRRTPRQTYRTSEGINSPAIDLMRVAFHRIIANNEFEEPHLGDAQTQNAMLTRWMGKKKPLAVLVGEGAKSFSSTCPGVRPHMGR
jgi:hypothetical protein